MNGQYRFQKGDMISVHGEKWEYRGTGKSTGKLYFRKGLKYLTLDYEEALKFK